MLLYNFGCISLNEYYPDMSYIQDKDISLKRDVNNPTTVSSIEKHIVKQPVKIIIIQIHFCCKINIV